MNRYIALLPNPVGRTAKRSLPCHMSLRMHSIRSSLRVSWTKPSREAFKAKKSCSLRSPPQMPWCQNAGISLTGSQSWLSFKYLLFLDQSEKSADSGLATDKQSSNIIRPSLPTQKKEGTPHRRLKKLQSPYNVKPCDIRVFKLYHWENQSFWEHPNSVVLNSLSVM